MSFKVLILASVLACARAGILGAPAAVAVPAAPAIAYSAAPAVSHISYSSPALSYATPLSTPLATAAITSQSQNNLPSFGGSRISTYHKTIDTPFSSVSKSDVRFHNNGLRISAAAAPLAYAAPAAYAPAAYAPAAYAPAAYAAPAAHLAYHAPAAPAAIGVAYSAAPAVSHVTFNGLAASYGW